jgi:hypothetical protein
MSRKGLEGGRKWMTGTDSFSGESLLSPFCQDTRHGRGLRERVIQGDPGAAKGVVPEVFLLVLGKEARMKDGLSGDLGLAAVNAPHPRE